MFISFLYLRGQSVDYIGCVSVGGSGDVSKVEDAVAVILNQDRQPLPVSLLTGEIGVQAVVRSTKKVTISCLYFIYTLVSEMLFCCLMDALIQLNI